MNPATRGPTGTGAGTTRAGIVRGGHDGGGHDGRAHDPGGPARGAAAAVPEVFEAGFLPRDGFRPAVAALAAGPRGGFGSGGGLDTALPGVALRRFTEEVVRVARTILQQQLAEAQAMISLPQERVTDGVKRPAVTLTAHHVRRGDPGEDGRGADRAPGAAPFRLSLPGRHPSH